MDKHRDYWLRIKPEFLKGVADQTAADYRSAAPRYIKARITAAEMQMADEKHAANRDYWQAVIDGAKRALRRTS